MNPRHDEATETLLVSQHGVIARRQLLELGWRAAQIDGAVRRGRLEAVHRGVYRVVGGGRPPGQAAMAAVLAGGPRSRISAAGVLAHHAVDSVAPDAVGVLLVARPERPRRIAVPWRRDHGPDDDHQALGPIRGTTVDRALIEVAWHWSDRRWLPTFDGCRWRRLATTVGVLEVAARLGRRHLGASRVLRLADQGVLEQESPGERRLAEVFSALGLGDDEVAWQVQVSPRHRVDALLVERGLVIEYDGRDFHTDPRDRAADHERDRELRELGYRVLRVGAEDLSSPARFRRRIELATAEPHPARSVAIAEGFRRPRK